MFFSKLALAASAAAGVSALAIPVARTNKDCPSPSQWGGVWGTCGKQSQNGLINVAVEACVVAEVTAILEGLGSPDKISTSQIEKAIGQCGDQSQNGLINIALELCVQAEIDAILTGAALTEREEAPIVERTNDSPSPSQWSGIWAECDKQSQNGLINVAVEACIAAEVTAILEGLGSPDKISTSQIEKVFGQCDKQSQNGLINVALEACVAAEVEAILIGLAPSKRTVGNKDCPSPSQWGGVWGTCGKQSQNGLINVAVEACVAAEVTAILEGLGNPDKISTSQIEKAIGQCGDQSQNGLINIALELCVQAEIDAILTGLAL